MEEVIFLIVLALVWVVFASVQDLRKREVANWLSFSLIIFVLGFRFFYSLFSEVGFNFFYQGLVGFGIFFAVGNLLYYGRMFAGGDAKLMIALGPVLAFSESFFINLKIFILFLLLFLFAGGVYGLVSSFVLALRNFGKFSKEFCNQLDKNRKLVYTVLFLGLILTGFGFIEKTLFFVGIFVFVMPYLYLFAKSVDESCMINSVRVRDLTEGDWLYENVKIGRKVIKAKWAGLDKKDISLIRKNKREILIKQGIPFVPVFLISFLVLVYLWFSGKYEWVFGLF
ncbi:MAG: prepilin peptidase [archaeon]